MATTPTPSPDTSAGHSQSVFDMVGAALSSDSGTSHTETPAEAAPAEPEATPTPEPEAPAPDAVASEAEQPSADAQQQSDAENPYEEADDLPQGTLDTLLKTSRGRTIYQGYKFTRDLAKPAAEGGLGFMPTTQEIVSFYSGHTAQQMLEHDLSSGDPNAATAALNHIFSPERQNVAALAQALPATLARHNPQAFLAIADNIVAGLPGMINAQSPAAKALYAKAERPILQNYLNSVLAKFETAQTDNYRNSLWQVANIIHKDLTGDWLNPEAPTAIKQPQQQADPLAAERQTIARERQAIQQERQNAINRVMTERYDGLNRQIDEVMTAEVDKALSPMKSTADERTYRRDVDDVKAKAAVMAQQADPRAWQLFTLAVNKYAQTGQGAENVQQQYLRLVKPHIAAARRELLKEANDAVLRKNQQQHDKMRQIATKVAPANGAATPAKPSAPAAQIGAKQANETQDEYVRRLTREALAS